MKCVACVFEGKVLTSNGRYQHVSRVIKGDKLFNMYGKPVTVKSVQHKQDVVVPVISIKHDCWFSVLECTENTEILTWDPSCRLPKWVQADYFGDVNNQQTILLPTRLEWTSPSKLACFPAATGVQGYYKLGFLIGAYLRIGYQKQQGVIGFHCDTSKKEIEDNIIDFVEQLFGASPKYRRGTFTFDLDFECDALYEMFSEFVGKGLPAQYLCKNVDYINGINDGIIFSGSIGHPTLTNTNVFEVLYWSSLSLGKPLHFGQLAHKIQNVPFITGRANLYAYQRQKRDVWNIDVDCKTGSYVVNNLVVRNVD